MRMHLAIVLISSPALAGPEVAQMLKSTQGTWKCKDATLVVKGELDGAWIHESLTGKVKLESFTTFDKQWTKIVLAADGTHAVATSDGMKDMKMDFASDAWREHVDASDLRRGLHVSAERSPDRGKTWTAVYDLTCRR
jgi:hypothetical protein